MAWWPRSATMSEVPIHLRVPAPIKGRWVQASRAARMRLTDWITVAVEAYMSQQLARAVPPPRIGFCGSAPGARGRRQRQFRRRRAAAHLPIELMQSEDNVAGLIIGWYGIHRQHDGAPDPVAEDPIAETGAEDRAGKQYSLQPGRA